MRRSFRAIVVVSLLAGTVFARQTAAPASDSPAAPDFDVTFRQQIKLSPQEMLAQGRATQQKAKQGLQRVLILQESARKQGDIIKLNCVNDKLARIKALLPVSDE